MSQWRRLPLILMALFALCAATVPSLSWACPMNARSSANAGAAVTLCRCPMAKAGSKMSCCAPAAHAKTPQKSCCQPVLQLPGNNRPTTLQATADFSALSASLSLAPLVSIARARPVAPLCIEPPILAAWNDAPPRLLAAQAAPAALAGRAPPRAC